MTAQVQVKAILFDFDGTLSTLRAGWETIMTPFMKETIAGGQQLSSAEHEALDLEIAEYIEQSTGIQTIYQMRWLAERSAAEGQELADEWALKAEYNRRLLIQVEQRLLSLENGSLNADDYLMKGSRAFLEQLRDLGIRMYIASGTDHPDVVREAAALGVASFFESIHGAPVGRAACSKEQVMRDLLDGQALAGAELAVIGDGKVEIRLAKEHGSLAIGLASDEDQREGIHPQKQARLLAAGADQITGDFQQLEQWLGWLGLSAADAPVQQ